MIRPGQVAGINGGTTTTEVARALAIRADLQSGGPDGAWALHAGHQRTQHRDRAGGAPEHQDRHDRRRCQAAVYELTGPLATGVLEQVVLDVAIIGVDGIDAEVGATAHHEGEASINRLMTKRAARVIVTADSSKAGRRAFARICAAEDVDVLVNDSGIDQAQLARLTEAGSRSWWREVGVEEVVAELAGRVIAAPELDELGQSRIPAWLG